MFLELEWRSLKNVSQKERLSFGLIIYWWCGSLGGVEGDVRIEILEKLGLGGSVSVCLLRISSK